MGKKQKSNNKKKSKDNKINKKKEDSFKNSIKKPNKLNPVKTIIKKDNDKDKQSKKLQVIKKSNELISKSSINNNDTIKFKSNDDNEKFNLWNPKETETTSSNGIEESLKGGQFRWLNERLYTRTSKDSLKEFVENPELFDIYHSGFRSQVQQWPINPLDIIINSFKNKKGLVIADMGCGEARLSETLSKQHTVHSFDLIAANIRVTACDISNVPLESESVDIVVFCLSLMGTNFIDFLKEAERILKPEGMLKIAEIESRVGSNFVKEIEKLNFKKLTANTKHSYFALFDFKKEMKKKQKFAPKVDSNILKPCLYKKR